MGTTQDTKSTNGKTTPSQPQNDFLNAPIQSTTSELETSTDTAQISRLFDAAYAESTVGSTASPEDQALAIMKLTKDKCDASLVGKLSEVQIATINRLAKSEIEFSIDDIAEQVNEAGNATEAQRAQMNYLLMRKEDLKSNTATSKEGGRGASFSSQIYESGTIYTAEAATDRKKGANSTIQSDINSDVVGTVSEQMGGHFYASADEAIHTVESAPDMTLHEWVSADNSEHGSIIEAKEKNARIKQTDLYDEDGGLLYQETRSVQKEDRAEALERKKAENANKRLRDRVEVNATLLEVGDTYDAEIGVKTDPDAYKADLGAGVTGQLSGEASTLTADAKAGVYYDPKKGLKVGGSAGAKYTLVGGGAKLTAGPYGFNLGGEKMRTEFTVGVSAGVLAEVNGELNLNVSKGADAVDVELETPAGAESEAKLAAFAGAKAGVEAGAKLDWGKKPDYRFSVERYTRDLIRNYLGGYTEYVPDYLYNEFAEHFASVVIGQGGWENLAAVKGGVEGSAGIGGEASYKLGLSGGRIKCAGTLKGTVGLGVGGKVSLDLDALDGVRFLGLMLFRAADNLLKSFGISPSQIQAKLRKKSEEAVRWLGQQIYEIGTGGSVDYLIPDSAAEYCANALGYSN